MSRWTLDTHTFVRRPSRWGLTLAPRDNVRAARIERRWRWPVLLAQLLTVPAFYAELLHSTPSWLSDLAYLIAAAVLATSLLHVARHSRSPMAHLLANPTDALLVIGLMVASLLPSSNTSTPALVLRMAVAVMSLVRMMWSIQHLITRGGLAYMLLMGGTLLIGCGMGFWWLEPTTPTLADGLWLAFTTAATVGYGDVVPTTPASRIFSVFVVLLGFGMLSLITAAIATSWVETEERRIEREILHDLRREIASVRDEVAGLRADLKAARTSQGEPV